MLKSIVVGYLAALVSVLAGVVKHENVLDSKSIVYGLWMETTNVIIHSEPC